jgi:hypothetical protein
MTTFDICGKCSVTYSAPEKVKGEYRITASIWVDGKPNAEFTVSAQTSLAAVDAVHREARAICDRWQMKSGYFSSF